MVIIVGFSLYPRPLMMDKHHHRHHTLVMQISHSNQVVSIYVLSFSCKSFLSIHEHFQINDVLLNFRFLKESWKFISFYKIFSKTTIFNTDN